jgi:hypothetical protein
LELTDLGSDMNQIWNILLKGSCIPYANLLHRVAYCTTSYIGAVLKNFLFTIFVVGLGRHLNNLYTIFKEIIWGIMLLDVINI